MGENKDKVIIKILHTAKRLFAERGFHETNRTEIRIGAHVSEATISTRFADEELNAKQTILLEILEAGWRNINNAIADLGVISDVRKRLKEILATIVDTLAKDKELRIIFVAESREVHKLGKRLMDGEVREVVRKIESMFAKGQNDGIFTKDISPKSMQRAFFGIVEEFLHSWVLSETMDYQTETSTQELEKTIDRLLLGFSISQDIPEAVLTFVSE